MKMANLEKYKFILEPRYYFFGWSKSGKIFGRLSAVKALVKAKKLLPKGYNFKVWDAWRSRDVQIEMINSFRRRFKVTHPKLSAQKREELVFTFAALPVRRVTRVDTHRRGGAFDLTIIDKDGNELYMGTDHDDLTEKAATDYFEGKNDLTAAEKEARKNRRLLGKVMLKAGFENYTPEWWHWSYKK